MKEALKSYLERRSIEVSDAGTDTDASVDYPDFGLKVAETVRSGGAEAGILICGTGIGMSIVANRYPRVRAALCHDNFTARMSRLHNDANVLVMGERVIGRGVAMDIVKTWLETEFEGSRHARRLQKIEELKPGK